MLTNFPTSIQKLIGTAYKHLKTSLVLGGTCLLGSAIFTNSAAVAGNVKGVLELYTSQGCSSCPPADELAAKYATDPNLVVLTLPVTYWDYLGWKDTYAKKAFTERQYSYAALRGDRSVYTPQVVVNGYDHAVGSNAREINKLLKRRSLPVDVNIVSKGKDMIIDVDGLSSYEAGTIWIALIKQKGAVSIGRGENRNREVTYTNIVRELRPLGDWNGDRMVVKLSKSDIMSGDANGFAIVLQTKHNRRPSNILGAAIWTDAES